MRTTKIDLPKGDIPKQWYNILPDLHNQFSFFRNAETGKKINQLSNTFTKTASKLEFSDKRWINIPKTVLNEYIHCGRPTPLIRAHRLEALLKTPAQIYYKCEDLSPAGTFKTNMAIPQAYWAMKEGKSRTISVGLSKTRTSFAHIFAAKTFDLIPTVYMTREECIENKKQIFFLKKMFGADLVVSPSNRTPIGRKKLEENPNNSGSMSTIQAEVVYDATHDSKAVIVVASRLNHILLTQTIIGLETKKQFEIIDKKPNILISSVGGGSGIHGLFAPFIRDYLRKKVKNINFIAVESEMRARLTNGEYKYVPIPYLPGLLLKMYQTKQTSLPKNFMGWGITSRNTAPITSLLYHKKIINTRVYPKDEKSVFEAAQIFFKSEGILVAPPSAYTVRALIDEALKAKKRKNKNVIVVLISAISYLDFNEKERYIHIS